ncbi:MAG: hypothetical protein M5U32_05675 [Myxococcota bacterium]|nr:hypothetical protein [Myxococcota bacterium]
MSRTTPAACASGPAHSTPRPGEHDEARHRIGRHHAGREPIAVALDVRGVVARVVAAGLLELGAKPVVVVPGRVGDEQRQGFRADQVVRRERRRARDLVSRFGVDDVERGAVAQRAQDLTAPGAIGVAARRREQSAQPRGDARRPFGGERGRRLRAAPAQRPRLALLGPALGRRDDVDHPFVGLARRLAPGEDAVLEQHHRVGGRLNLRGVGGGLREVEARLHVRQQDRFCAEGVTQTGQAVLAVAEREDRIGMRVIDHARRQPGVQQGLDRWRRGAGVEQRAAQLVHHRLVGKRRQRAQSAQPREIRAGQALRDDRCEIVAGRLHEQRGDLLAEPVLVDALPRRVAAAVQHQRRLGAEQPTRVDAQRQLLTALRRPLLAGGAGVGVGPAALHRTEISSVGVVALHDRQPASAAERLR